MEEQLSVPTASEQVIQIMINQWEVPEAMVREFMTGLVGGNSIHSTGGLEALREAATNLLQDLILETE